MSETKKLIRRFALSAVWVLFLALTLGGIIYAGERTAFVSRDEEPETLRYAFGDIFDIK